VKFASVLIRDFPDLNNQTFTYSIPDVFENRVKFGSIVFIPFGLRKSKRIGVVVEIKDTNEDFQSLKNIEEVVVENSGFTEDKLNYLKFISMYFFIPLSNLLEYSNLLIKETQPDIFYKVNYDKLSTVGRIKNKLKIVKYFETHKDGFKEKNFRIRFKLKKDTKVLINLETNGILEKYFIFNKYETSISPKNKKEYGIYILNGLDFESKLRKYNELIEKENIKKVLIISPDNLIRSKLRIDNNVDCDITFGSKLSIIDVKNSYDLVIIDDLINNEYEITKPFDFDLEKTAIMRAIELGEKIVFSSYIPSVYSFSELKEGRVKHFNKNFEIVNSELKKPELIIVDLKKEIKKHGFFIIPRLINKELNEVLSNNGKSLILVNRKGYYNLLVCKQCGYTVKCPLCSVPLTYHYEYKNLICRYCGHIEYESYICPECGGISIRYTSAGTEKYELDLKTHFKDIKILRIDRNNFPKNPTKLPEYQIAVGTSLSLELLDMEEIDMVAFMGIDSTLNQPSYKSIEKTLYFLSRVFEKMISNKRKKIYIPTFTPYAGIFRYILKEKFSSDFYISELDTRTELKYPPFVDMYEIEISSKFKDRLPEISKLFYETIKLLKEINLISLKPMLSQNPYGIYRSRIIIKSDNILNSRNQLGIIIDSFRKKEKVEINVRNMG
jgi:primosomal protein N' (replication factor Y) (superfamily II helicase)